MVVYVWFLSVAELGDLTDISTVDVYVLPGSIVPLSPVLLLFLVISRPNAGELDRNW
jgi:hypothetical protein